MDSCSGLLDRAHAAGPVTLQLHDIELDDAAARIRGLELDAHELQRVAALVIIEDRAAMFVARRARQNKFVEGGLVHQRPAAQLRAAELDNDVSGREIAALDDFLCRDAEARG